MLRAEDKHDEFPGSQAVSGSFEVTIMYGGCSNPVALVVECDGEVVLRKQVSGHPFRDFIDLGTILR